MGMPIDKYPWPPLDYTQIPEIESCGLCGKPMEILRVNSNVCFWVHNPEDAEKCKAPIAFKTSFTRGVREFLDHKLSQLEKNIAKAKRPCDKGEEKRASANS